MQSKERFVHVQCVHTLSLTHKRILPKCHFKCNHQQSYRRRKENESERKGQDETSRNATGIARVDTLAVSGRRADSLLWIVDFSFSFSFSMCLFQAFSAHTHLLCLLLCLFIQFEFVWVYSTTPSYSAATDYVDQKLNEIEEMKRKPRKYHRRTCKIKTREAERERRSQCRSCCCCCCGCDC